jgi:23S rRNA (guanosine2251-2'-O)-methyltransferase
MEQDTQDSVIVGVHSVYEALASAQRRVQRLHVSRGSMPKKVRQIVEIANARGIQIRREGRDALDRIARGIPHQGVAAIVGVPSYVPFERILESEKPLIVVLDGVQDPQNLGAVIRTAETAGATGLVVTERRSVGLTAVVSRTSAGALEYLPVARVSNLVTAINAMKKNGIWVVAVDPDAPDLWTEFDYTVPVALVLGSEHRGVRRLVRENCDLGVRLPMQGQIDSLNVSVAAGVVLFEVVRQRRM